MSEQPPPIPVDDASPRGATSNDTSPPGDRPSRRTDRLESLLSQWGASSADVNDHTLGGSRRGDWASISRGLDNIDLYSLRIDRSASLDEDEMSNVATSVLSERPASHRRISSTGGDRLPFQLPQVFDEGETLIDLAALHDAARITDWPSVLSLSQSHPESAKYVGKEGWNALHHACDRRCPHVDVMESLLTAYPGALVQTNDKGWTPLHRACRNKTPRDVVKLLLRKYPDLGKRAATMRCNDGRSALHYALLYDAPDGVVDLLLQADPGAVLDEDRDRVTPLGTVWDKYANSFEGKRMLQILRPFEAEGWESGGITDNAHEGELAPRSDKEAAEKRVREVMEKDQPAFKSLQTSWKTANTLLRAYFRFPLQEGKLDEDSKPSSEPTPPRRKWRVFHATCAIKCHPKLVLMARALHPEEALEVDENDLFRAGHDVNPFPNPQSNQMSNRTALHFAAMSPLSGREGRNVIKLLLKLNPHAARQVDGYGSLPLHLICQNVQKMQWASFGPKDVYEAYTEASTVRDGTGRTPLNCIASSVGQYKHSSSARPSSIQTQNAGGPVAGVAADESVIQNLVEANSIAASMPDNSGRLPLHYIAEGAEEWTPDVTSILTAHPAAAQTRAGPSTSNQLPLHMAASSPDARPSLIMNLVLANPRAASIMDGVGRLPLHLSVDSGRTTWDRGIESIFSAFTPAISAPEGSPRRWTVLHTAAASHSAGRELIEHIISLAENLASIPDGDGKYPLHLACATNKSWGTGGVQAIFDADPSVGLSEDSNRLLPFHIAALRSCMAPNKTLSDRDGDDYQNETTNTTAQNDAFNDDLESLEVLFNLLTAQPSIVSL
jgi:ankyrin repeat protein